jgi:D-galactarolactone isomerase
LKPGFSGPEGACDTHLHFYDSAIANAEGGPPLPGHYDVAAYRAVQDSLGLERAIVVQPNAYQFDNRVMLAALAELGEAARGVAVVRPSATDAELERMTQAGVRAQRFYALKWGAAGFDAMAETMARLHDFGWHANVQLDGRTLPQREQELLRLPGRFVIDHVGKFLPPVDVGHPAFIALLRLLDSGRCWVKLSSPYESSQSGPPQFDDVSVLVRALVRHAPHRMLWASNWPHPFPPNGFKPDNGALLALLADWAPDAAQRHRILVDNPAELYGF